MHNTMQSNLLKLSFNAFETFRAMSFSSFLLWGLAKAWAKGRDPARNSGEMPYKQWAPRAALLSFTSFFSLYDSHDPFELRQTLSRFPS